MMSSPKKQKNQNSNFSTKMDTSLGPGVHGRAIQQSSIPELSVTSPNANFLLRDRIRLYESWPTNIHEVIPGTIDFDDSEHSKSFRDAPPVSKFPLFLRQKMLKELHQSDDPLIPSSARPLNQPPDAAGFSPRHMQPEEEFMKNETTEFMWMEGVTEDKDLLPPVVVPLLKNTTVSEEDYSKFGRTLTYAEHERILDKEISQRTDALSSIFQAKLRVEAAHSRKKAEETSSKVKEEMISIIEQYQKKFEDVIDFFEQVEESRREAKALERQNQDLKTQNKILQRKYEETITEIKEEFDMMQEQMRDPDEQEGILPSRLEDREVQLSELDFELQKSSEELRKAQEEAALQISASEAKVAAVQAELNAEKERLSKETEAAQHIVSEAYGRLQEKQVEAVKLDRETEVQRSKLSELKSDLKETTGKTRQVEVALEREIKIGSELQLKLQDLFDSKKGKFMSLFDSVVDSIGLCQRISDTLRTSLYCKQCFEML
eukprot:946372_1